MSRLNEEYLHIVTKYGLQKDIFRGQFGFEKENLRVDAQGRLALTPHPKVFGHKTQNPYIKTDFSESQIEMITPIFPTIEEAFDFMETLHDIVTLELEGEYLWPSSNPPHLPSDEEIPIAMMDNTEEEEYRQKLSERYGKKRQLMCGVHFNFSFHEEFLSKLYEVTSADQTYRQFCDQLYLKVARNTLRYGWLLVYLTGASPVFNSTYIEQCVRISDHLDEESHFFRQMNSLRNSICGYQNQQPLMVSLDSLEAYVRDLQTLVKEGKLLDAREYYHPIRVKPVAGKDMLTSLLEQGIAYLELRLIDLNPLYKSGMSKDTMRFIHLFLVMMLLFEEEPWDLPAQSIAVKNHESLIWNGIKGRWYESSDSDRASTITLQGKAIQILEQMGQMLQVIHPDPESVSRIIELERRQIQSPELNTAEIIKSEIQRSSYITYHMDKARQYARESRTSGYRFHGFEDLELSTQLLLKAAVKRGILYEFMDREDNFIRLQQGDRVEFVKQATKTSLDSYSTVLVMENKVVTNKVLVSQGIRVPVGRSYNDSAQAIQDYEMYRHQPIVIKPRSTNFGIGITIFQAGFSESDYRRALAMAYEHDTTIMIEEFISGKEYRFLVMGDEVVGVLHRVPANVIGDGQHTIEQLVQLKNQDPLRGEGYRTPLERIRLGETEEMFLKQQRKHRWYVPASGEVVYLRENSNISTGGDSIDYTDDIPGSYKEIAVRAAKVVGATFCGVDMMISNMQEEAELNNYCIIELNFNPAIHIHCYPYQGKNRKADEKILDLLFG